MQRRETVRVVQAHAEDSQAARLGNRLQPTRRRVVEAGALTLGAPCPAADVVEQSAELDYRVARVNQGPRVGRRGPGEAFRLAPCHDGTRLAGEDLCCVRQDGAVLNVVDGMGDP